MHPPPHPSPSAGPPGRQASNATAPRLAPEFEVFFDGDCPLCRREVSFLRKRDSKGAILFTNIASHDFDASALGLDRATLMSEIHGRLPDGQVISGVQVFRHLYSIVGFKRLAAWSGFAPFNAVLERAYRSFAKNRLRLTGRCHETCMVEGRAPVSEAS